MPTSPALSGPPRPERRPSVRSHHGHDVTDPYAWLADADDPATLAHLEAENAWTDGSTAHLAELRAEIFEEIRRRTQETDLSVPVKDGPWWYLHRTEEGRAYGISCRRPDDGTGRGWVEDPAAEQVLLDLNELVEEGGYLSLGVHDVSPDGNWLAYATDRAGDERHELCFLDLRSGETSAEKISDVAYGFAWAGDSRTCWYTVQDEASRPHRVLRHMVGSDPADDVEVFHEPDERFHIGVGGSRSRRVVFIGAGSAITSETWILDAEDPTAPPVVVAEREEGVEYSVDHHPSGLLITSNHGGAEDFALWRAELDGVTPAPRERWTTVIAHDPGTRLLGVDTFADHAVVVGRTDGLTAMWLLDLDSGELRPFQTDEPIGTITPGSNAEFETSTYRFGYQSLATPPMVIDQDVATGERIVRKQLPVLDDFDASAYRTEQLWATADDGTLVPMSVVWRPDRTVEGEPAPCVLYGYGSYEASMDPWFSIARLSLLDRGVIFAVAHVRGGGEMGRAWYENGKFGSKANTFTDFVACARHLVDTGRTAPDRLAARGGSAGGLLMGAVVNLAPELFRSILAEVPFVDPLTTMLDPSLPLTVIEWEEWGDPLHDPEAYGWIGAYSPYENVRSADDVTYPAILATTGLNDPRVGYHEPTKWVARLRDVGHGRTDGGSDGGRPVLLKVELGAGHGGPTGRYDAWRDEAFNLAFLLDTIGADG